MLEMGRLKSSSGKIDASLDWNRQAKEAFSLAATSQPDSLDARRNLAMAQNNNATTLTNQGRLDEAMQEHTAALKIRKCRRKKLPMISA